MAREDIRGRTRQTDEMRSQSVDYEREPMDVHIRLSMEEETDCMAVEDRDVRYESPWRRSELCWLCLRCCADEDDYLLMRPWRFSQDFDDQWRKIKCDWNTPHHRGGSQHSCSCALCSDCWLEKARDNRCPVCRVDITAWRMNAYAGPLHIRNCSKLMRLSKRRRVLKHQTD